jgi:hypothetical protein
VFEMALLKDLEMEMSIISKWYYTFLTKDNNFVLGTQSAIPGDKVGLIYREDISLPRMGHSGIEVFVNGYLQLSQEGHFENKQFVRASQIASSNGLSIEELSNLLLYGPTESTSDIRNPVFTKKPQEIKGDPWILLNLNHPYTRKFAENFFEPLIERVEPPYLGEWEALSELGQGGFSNVLEVSKLGDKKSFALKYPRRENDTFTIDKYKHEFEILSHLRSQQEHINVAYPNELRDEFIVFEDVGIPLDKYLEEMPLTFKGVFEYRAKRLSYALQAINVVLYNWKNGVVHNDLSLENFIVLENESFDELPITESLKLTDYQMSERISSEKELKRLLMEDEEKGIDASESSLSSQENDFYQAGIIIYQLLSGKDPRFMVQRESKLSKDEQIRRDIIDLKELGIDKTLSKKIVDLAYENIDKFIVPRDYLSNIRNEMNSVFTEKYLTCNPD